MPNPSNTLSDRFHQALSLAFDLHGRDARKGGKIPYISHLLSVCVLVQQDGGDEDEAIAALLHDALEDKPDLITREQISAKFGERVLKLIELCTDTPADFTGGEKPAWRTRKEAYLIHLRTSPPDMLRITLADKVDNARAIHTDLQRIGSDLWKRFNAGREDQFWYYYNAAQVLRDTGLKSPLLDELDSLICNIWPEKISDGSNYRK